MKALAWDPHPHVFGVLATGGGTQDKLFDFGMLLMGLCFMNQIPVVR